MMRTVAGVFGASVGEFSAELKEKAREVGRALAARGCVVVSGGCTGLPHEAARAAKENGAIVIGVSPAASEEEHVKGYRYPTDAFDFIVYTGFGYKGRNVVSVRSCDIAVFIGGGMGTLNELTIAYDEGKRIGVLKGSGGITDLAREIATKALRKTGAIMAFDGDPESLVRKLTGNGKEG